MFKKQRVKKAPFYEPVNLKHYYDTAKIYDSKKEPEPISEEVFHQIELQKLKIHKREKATQAHKEYMSIVE